MAYIRCDKNCDPKVQPGNINVTDTFGNTNDFFHVDYVRCDKDCNPNPIPFDPNNPQNTVHTNPDVLFFDTDWTRRLSNNGAGTKSQYVQGLTFPVGGTYPPDHPNVGSGSYIILPTKRYNEQFLEPVYLATEGDDDLRIVDEANDDIFVISFTEALSVDDEGGITGQLLLNEEGSSEVTNESGNPVEL